MALGLYELINNINKQIKGICCKIDNLDPGGGGGTNIYNSDGTLTGNRILSGNNNNLSFSDLNIFETTDINGNPMGLKISRTSSLCEFGPFGDAQITINGNNGDINIGDTYNLANSTKLIVFPVINIIKTSHQNNDIGLKLDFANNIFEFGDVAGVLNTFQIKIGDFVNGQSYIRLSKTNVWSNSSIENGSAIFGAGDINGAGNLTNLIINDNTQEIKTGNQGNDIGLKLDFANSIYEFGQITSGNLTYIKIDDSGLDDIIINGKNIFIGDRFISQNGTVLIVDDNNETISTFFQGGNYGIALEYFQTKYKFGQLTGGNTTYLTIDDTAAYPVQLTGTNISSGTAGAASGQFLKIKVGGVDYKLALLNP